MDEIYRFLMELDKLKSIARRSYIFDLSRNENSAEHSWHLALAILTLKDKFEFKFDLLKTIKMALVHDICEIGAGDISIYDPERSKKEIEERDYLDELSGFPVSIASEIKDLWEEYEEQKSTESRWVKVVDRLLPFMMNLNTNGLTWKEQGIRKSQVIEVNKIVSSMAPDIYQWMLVQIDEAVKQGWLVNS